MTIRDYMVQRFNGRKWVVARETAKMIAKGYEVFLSQREWAALKSNAAANGFDVWT